MLISQEMLQGTEQESAQPAFFALDAAQAILLQQIGKERLHEILCVRGRMTAPTQERIKRRPVRLTNRAESRLRGYR